MGAVSGAGTTFTLPNYIGDLFLITPSTTPLLSMMGGLNGFEPVFTKEFSFQTEDNAAAAQPSILEGADATFAERSRAEVINTLQIHQEGIYVTYTKLAAIDQISSTYASLGLPQPVTNEVDHQVQLKLKKIARDANYSGHQGAYQQGANISTARTTKGIASHTSTNAVSASSARLNKDHLDQMFKLMADNGCPFENVVLYANAFNKQRISAVYGVQPASYDVGGVAIDSIMTDFGKVGVAYDRDVSTSTVEAVEMSVTKLRAMPIPGKGFLFFEPLASSGSYIKGQLYGELGFEWGPETFHGKITSTATS